MKTYAIFLACGEWPGPKMTEVEANGTRGYYELTKGPCRWKDTEKDAEQPSSLVLSVLQDLPQTGASAALRKVIRKKIWYCTHHESYANKGYITYSYFRTFFLQEMRKYFDVIHVKADYIKGIPSSWHYRRRRFPPPTIRTMWA